MTVLPWMQELTDAVAAEMLPAELAVPIGCHVCELEGLWEISLFASNIEMVGGRRDGRCVQPKFTMNLLAILSQFDDVREFSWQNAPVGNDDELGGHVAVEGIYHGHPVRLQILGKAPRQFAAGCQILVHENSIVETW